VSDLSAARALAPPSLAAHAAIARTALRQALSERTALVGRLAFYAILLLVFSRLWQAVAERGALGSVGTRDLLWYLAITEWIVLALPPLHLDIEADLRSGDLAAQLSRPVPYLSARLAGAAGDFALRSVSLGAAAVVIATWFAGGLPADPRGLLLAIPLGLLGSALGLLFLAWIGLFAFWLHDVSPIYWIWQSSSGWHSHQLRVRSPLRFAGALVGTNLRASFALRGAFLAQLAFMALNNVVWFSIWWLFFERFEQVRGWRVTDLMLLFGTVATAFGVTVVLAGGVRELARTIQDGELDALLTQPRSPLFQAIASRSVASGWGDALSGMVLVILSGYLDPGRLPLAAVAIAASATVFVSTGVLLHSLAFFAGRVDSFARQVFEFVLTISIYPESLFTGALQLMLYTLVPAGFIGFLPARLVREPSPLVLLAVLCGALAYASLAVLVFRAGLRRYTSGSRFTLRG
jgi:ABC-2 type transport system permease protein